MILIKPNLAYSILKSENLSSVAKMVFLFSLNQPYKNKKIWQCKKVFYLYYVIHNTKLINYEVQNCMLAHLSLFEFSILRHTGGSSSEKNYGKSIS